MSLLKRKMTLILLPTLLLLNACSSHEDVIAVSDVHLYNENYGVLPDPYADAIIEQEIISMYSPVEVEVPYLDDPTLTTELTKDPDAFYAEEFVPTPEIITYKYKFDPNFYTTAEWRTME